MERESQGQGKVSGQIYSRLGEEVCQLSKLTGLLSNYGLLRGKNVKILRKVGGTVNEMKHSERYEGYLNLREAIESTVDDYTQDWDRLIYGPNKVPSSLWDRKQWQACLKAGKAGISRYSDPNEPLAYTAIERRILGIKRPAYLA